MKKFYCKDCHKYYDKDNVEEITIKYSNKNICEHCFNSHYVICSDCLEAFHDNDSKYIEKDDKYLCKFCLKKH